MTARALFVLAAAVCATFGGWLAVAVLAGWRVALRWNPQGVAS